MKFQNVGIIDLGINNISSLKKSINKVDPELNVISLSLNIDVEKLDVVFLPGVGNFGAGIRSLKVFGLDQFLQEYVVSGKPLIAICLGMQLLFSESEESPGSKGLSFFDGTVKKLDGAPGNPVPNVGWNEVTFIKEIDESLRESRDFYFTHSYYVEPSDMDSILCLSRHGSLDFASGVIKENIMGFQFHPEKSGLGGLNLLKRSLNWAQRSV
jgi:glutamine amidotransferase